MLNRKIRRILLGVLSAPCWTAVVAQTLPLTVDKSVGGAQPVVGTSHGVPVIQIVPPSAAGVSLNRFTHFNVGPSGAVLNNSGGASQTQIAGQIAGNPMLGNQRATTILNQVTAPNPSQLRGMLEVAGHHANVIVANPAGITCNGCGFLNATRATLTTGRPAIGPKGNIALDVAAGKISIEGQGLDGTQVRQVDLFARALAINAGVWADHLNVAAGAARVDADSGKASALAGQGPVPKFALDTAALGGMYANSIRLIGTEAGVGVNIAGNLVALTGDLSLNAAGDVRIVPNATLSAKKTLALNVSGQLDTRKAVLHGSSVKISAQTLRNQEGRITAAGPATLQVQGELLNAGGLIAAAGDHRLEAGQLNNHGGTLAGGSLTAAVKGRIDNRKGLMLADNTLRLSAVSLSNDDTLDVNQTAALAQVSTASAGATASVESASASSGAARPTPLATGVTAKTVDIRVAQVNNAKGAIHARNDLVLVSEDLKNPSGQIAAQRNTRIDTQDLRNRQGTIAADQQLTVHAKGLDGLGWLRSGTDLAFTHSGSLTPQGNFTAGRDFSLDLGGALVNKTRLTAGRDLRIKADSLNNTATGELLAGRHSTIDVTQTMTNAGLIDAHVTRISAGQLHNRGRIYGDGVSISAGTLVNDAGPKGSALIASRGNLNVGAGSLTNRHHSVLYAKDHLRVGGAIDAAKRVAGQADQVQNISATIEAGRTITIAASQIHNQNANFVSETVQVSSKPKVYFTPEGSTTMYDAASHWLCDTVTRGCSRRPEWLNDDPERRLLLPSAKYPAARYGPPFDYAPNERGRAGISSPIALTHTPAGRQCIGRECRPTPERFRYSRDAKIWSVFGVEPPAGELPAWKPSPQSNSRKSQSLEQQRKTYEATPAYKDYKARHLALDSRIKAFNRDFLNRLVKHFTFYEVNEILTQTRTVRSDPGRIFAAGALNLKGVVTNDKSQIAAGGKLTVDGPAIHNIGATGWRTVTREGQATFTQARSSDRKAHRAPYKAIVASDPFDLPVGAVRTALAPKVQLPARQDASQTYGTLIAGRNTHLTAQGDLINSGTIGARDATVVNALNIINHSGGQIQARRIDLAARENLSNLAARIQGDTVALRAGQNINLLSAETSDDFGATRGTHLSGVSSVSANDLLMQAGNDINLLAAQVSVERNARLQAGRDIRLDELVAQHRETISSGPHQRHELSTNKVIGSGASAKGDLAIAAGQDVSARAAEIHAQRQLIVNAGRDVILQAGVDSGAAKDQYREKKKSLLSSKTEDTTVSTQWKQPHASTLTGKNVEISAGRDVTVQGSNVGAQQHLDIAAAGNVNIDPGRRQSDSSRVEKVKKSGVGATGGMSVGRRKQTHSIQESAQSNTPSTLGSLKGNTTIRTGQAVNVTASTIIAPEGNITLAGQQVTIGAAQDTHHKQESFEIKQTGVSVTVNNPLVNGMQAIGRAADTADKTDNPLMKGLAVAAAGLEAISALDAVQKQEATEGAKDLDKLGGIQIGINVGKNKQSSKTERAASTAAGSTVAAGKDLTILAEGAGEVSDINVKGSRLSAGGNTQLNAEGNINLQAAENTVDTKHKSRGSSSSIGVAVSLGSNGASIGAVAGATNAKGKANSRDKTMTNTKVTAGQKLTLQSGADTNVQGAVASGKQVVAEVGGNLSIESLQDTSTFESKHRNIGGSVVVGAGFAGSASYAQDKVKGDFASVREQSGIQAGDAGFDVHVKGNTNLKGAVIASTAEAVQAGVNRISTGTLTVSDIENHSDYKASGVALAGGFSVSGSDKESAGKGNGKANGKADGATDANAIGAGNNPDGIKASASTGKATTVAGAGYTWAAQNIGRDTSALAPGFSKTSGNERSTTKSGISGATVTITDHEKQRALTGKTAQQLLATLNQEIKTGDDAGGLSKTWDPEKLRAKVSAEAEIVAAFTQQTSQTIRSYTDEKRAALRQQISEKTDEQEKQALQQQISELNTQERILNVIVGALTGSADVAALQAGLSEAADRMREYTIADSRKFAGITDGVTTLDNKSGKSAGIRQDEVKAAGVRLDLDILCGRVNERCKVQKDANRNDILDERGVPILDLHESGMVQFDPEKAQMSLAKFLLTAEGADMSGFTGGIQGGEGTLGGKSYRQGGVLDLFHEAYAGTHDVIGGTVSGLYDAEGNAQRGMTPTKRTLYEIWSGVALVPATPFALSEILSPEAWHVIDTLLNLKK
ncbi:Filamentous haemagglutinin FhaB/tRNA nuclease CdiA-like TPS domain-containing protein [Bordetella tumbae]|uniref:two-partner secretion domain-containing protein n=1 Tax=Bordetella tumbae TaxID=1649139 RepID=UPI0039EEC159